MAMNRRDALKSFVLLMGGTMVGANVLLTGCAPEDRIEGLEFSENDIAFLDELGETIIPATDTPGAKAAGIGQFMVMMVKDTYNSEQQETFTEGINYIRSNFKDGYDKDYMEASQEERVAYLNDLNSQAGESDEKGVKVVGMLRDLTVLGYFTSEIGATQQLSYYESPGRFDACIDYKEGDKVYAI